MLAKVFVGLTLASSAFATVFITAPFETSSFAAGQEATIQWQDDGSEPTLEEFGPAKFSIYTGNAQEQTLLQEIDTNVDVSQASSLSFVPSAAIGPDSNQYFIRVESLSSKDPTNPSIPALAFSSRFSLTGMTGEFSDTASSQIAAQSTAPLKTATVSSGSSTVVATSARITTSISSRSAAPTSTSPSSASSKSKSSSSTSSTSSSFSLPLPPSTASSAPTDLASAITVPASSAMLGAQVYTGFLVTLLGALVGVMVL